MTLLLTSAGIVPEIRKDFLSILPKSKPELNKVAFITTAAFGEAKNPDWLEKDRQLLQQCGIKEIYDFDIKDKTKSEVEKFLSDKDIIYVNGGNTFYLLHWAKQSGFNELIPNLIKKDKLYIGVSAGSYLACPTIEMANWKHQDRNKVGIKDFAALNLVPFLITAHFEDKYRAIVELNSKNTKYPIVALTNQQAVLIKDGKTKIIGVGKKEFWNGFKEILQNCKTFFIII